MDESVKVLTPLEAVMLGLYLIGMRWVAKDAYTTYATVEAPVRNAHGYVLEEDEDLQPIGCGSITGYTFSSISHGNDIKLLPWLTAHGITPPEVST